MASSTRRRDGFSGKAFQALLALYPAAFRDDYGRELSLVFIDRYRDAAGFWDRAGIWLEAISGVLMEAPQEHVRMIAQDLRAACRALRHSALVTTTVVVTLGLGLGANTAVFSVLNAVALRTPLRVPEPEQLYTVNGGEYVRSGQESARLSGPMFDALRRAAPPGVGVAAMSRGIARVYTRTERERETTPAYLQLVSPDFFTVLGVPPVQGRAFEGGDGAPDARVAVIGHAYWQRRFNGSPDVVGSTLSINGAPFTIVGVGPRDFAGVWLETPVDVWVPLAMQPVLKYSQSFSADGADLRKPWLPQPQIWWLHVVVRVPPGLAEPTVGAFNASLSNLAAGHVGIVLEPFGRGLSQLRQRFSKPLVALMIMAGLVLLVACANVANVLLARGVGRQQELAVRMAIGAGRARLLHQLLTESVLLVIMASLVAILVAGWAGDLLVRLATATMNGAPPFAAAIDLRVLAFAAGAAFLSVAVFGVWPAWRATRVDLVDVLKSGSRSACGAAARPTRALVVLQVALSLVLATGTGLLVRSFQSLRDVGLGFEPERLLTVVVDPKLSGRSSQELPEMYRRLLDAVEGTAGVESAALAMCGLEGPCSREDGFVVEGYQPRPHESLLFSVNVVTPGYFSTVGMRLIAGRALSATDRDAASRVAVVNKILAATYFGDWRRAIGRRIGPERADIEIVGVVDDARGVANLKAPAMPAPFVPLSQGVVPRTLEVRTSVEPASVIAAVRRAITRAAPELPVDTIETATVRVRRGLSQERLVVVLTSMFSALAIGLAGLGLFGVLSYAVARRTPELGLRLALGASRSRVLWSVVRDALWLVACGVLLGLPLVALGSRLASALIFGVSPYDGLSLVAAVVVLLGIGAACGIVPALRAARVDPMIALRQE